MPFLEQYPPFHVCVCAICIDYPGEETPITPGAGSTGHTDGVVMGTETGVPLVNGPSSNNHTAGACTRLCSYHTLITCILHIISISNLSSSSITYV
jgi:hypothetical protein